MFQQMSRLMGYRPESNPGVFTSPATPTTDVHSKMCKKYLLDGIQDDVPDGVQDDVEDDHIG